MPGSPATQFLPTSNLVRIGLNKVVRGQRDSQARFAFSLFAQDKFKQLFERIQAVSKFGYPTQRAQDGGVVTFDQLENIGSIDLYVVAYGTGFGVTAEAEYRDLYNILSKKAQQSCVGEAYRNLENYLAADKFNNHTATTAFALNTKGYVGVDAVAMVSHSHPTSIGSTWSNRGDGTNDIAFSNLNIETAMSQLRKQKTYRGIPQVMTGPFTLLVPTTLGMAARRYVNSQLLPQSANNDKNINVTSGITQVIEDPFLSSTTAWWLVSNNAADRDLHFARGMDISSMVSEDPHTFQVNVGFNAEMATYHVEPYGVWGTTGA